jgi:hypothetical protein
MGYRTVFSGNQNRTWHGPLRGAQVSRLAPPHHDMHAGTFLPVAPEKTWTLTGIDPFALKKIDPWDAQLFVSR